jgi:hypothetical protein
MFVSEAVMVQGETAEVTVTFDGSSVKAAPQESPYEQVSVHPEIGVKVKKSVYEKLFPGPWPRYEIKIGAA